MINKDDPVRAALADEFEGAIQITIRKRNEAGRVVAESLMAQHREVVVAALRRAVDGGDSK